MDAAGAKANRVLTHRGDLLLRLSADLADDDWQAVWRYTKKWKRLKRLTLLKQIAERLVKYRLILGG